MKYLILTISLVSLINLSYSFTDLKPTFFVTGKIEDAICEGEKAVYSFIIPGYAENFESDHKFNLKLSSPKNVNAVCTIYYELPQSGIFCEIDSSENYLNYTDIKLSKGYKFDFEMIDWDIIGDNSIIEKHVFCEPYHKYEFIPEGDFIDKGCVLDTHDRRLDYKGNLYKIYDSQSQDDIQVKKDKTLNFTLNIQCYDSTIKADCYVNMTKTRDNKNILRCDFHNYGDIHYNVKFPVIRDTNNTRIKIGETSTEYFHDCKTEYTKIGLLLLVSLSFLLL